MPFPPQVIISTNAWLDSSFPWETLHFVTGFVLTSSRAAVQYKHELRYIHDDLIRMSSLNLFDSHRA